MERCFLWVAGKNMASVTTEFLMLCATNSKTRRQAAPGAIDQARTKIFKSKLVTEALARPFPFKACSFSSPSSPPSQRKPAGNGVRGWSCPSQSLTFPSQHGARGDELRAHIHTPENVKPWQPDWELGEPLGALAARGIAKPGCN